METINRMVLTFLINSLWQAPLIACVAALCARMMRRAPARYRHVVWTMALAACLVLPCLSVARHWDGDAYFEGVAAASSPSPATETDSGGKMGRRDPFKLPTVPSGFFGEAAMTFKRGFDFLNRRSRSIPLTPLVSMMALGFYALSLTIHGFRLGRSWRKTMEIARSAHVHNMSPKITWAAERIRAECGLDKISILISSLVAGPVTLGVLRPGIILPESLLREISATEALSIFAHEMAHIRRRDYLINMLCEMASLPVAFHPAVSLIKRKIIETREMACDEAATRGMPSAADYAHSLVGLARRISATPLPSLSGYSLGVFDANILEERIMGILDLKNTVRTRRARVTLVLGVVLLAATSVFASAMSFGVIQAATSPADALTPWVGTWVAKLKGKPMTCVVLRREGSRASGTITSFHVTLDDQGQPEEAGAEAHVWQIRSARVEGTALTLTAEDNENPAHEFQLVRTGAAEAEFKVVGAPPPPGDSGDHAGLKMVKETEGSAQLQDGLKPFVGTWQAMFQGQSFTTLKLAAEGSRLIGSMSSCRIEMDANGKLTRAERKDGGAGWRIIEATFDGAQLRLKAKEEGTEDVDEFEMKLTGDNTADFKPAGTPMPVEPWKMERGEAKSSSGIFQPAPAIARAGQKALASSFRIARGPDAPGNRQAGHDDRSHQ